MVRSPFLTRNSALLPLLLAGSCASAPDEAVILAIEKPSWCGTMAAMRPGRSQAERYSPPACALPSAAEVASSCAIHDLVSSPDYRVPDLDENGVEIDPQPTPEYRVQALRCDFATPERNRALCRFKLSLPGEQEPGIDRTVTFEHIFWQDHGPTHHLYGTRWRPATRCARPAA
jgi:hypothetical protein